MRRLLLALLIPLCAHAQSAAPTEFPESAQPLPPETLRERLAGKVFDVKLADGTGWRLEYKSSGYFFVDVSSGGRDSGRWRVEGSQLCVEPQRGRAGCSEVRAKDERVYLKRGSTGEVVAFVLR